MRTFPQGPWVSRACSVLVLMIGVCLLGVAAQSSLGPTRQTTAHKISPPQLPQPPAVDQEQFLPYWTTEPGWQSEIQLRNNQQSADLTVTPVLRTTNGTETSLQPVTIKPREALITDIATALASVAPNLIGSYGSVVLRYKAPTEMSLYSMAMIRGAGKPLALHIDSSSQLPSYQTGSREGIWWLPGGTIGEYLIVSNQGKTQVQAELSLYDASGKAFRQKLALAPQATIRLSLQGLVTAGGLSGSYGGITVSASQNAGSLDTLNFLFDENAGFSALLKMYDHNPSTKLTERDFAKTGTWTLHAPMLALSLPDPALEFPAGTALRPQLLIRNTTAAPVDANLSFQWRRGNETGAATGPNLHLTALQTLRVDVAALQQNGVLPSDANWAAVKLTTTGNPGDIMAVASSYDQTLKYGAQTPFSDQLAHHWVGSVWEYDSTHDSFITVGNGGTKPAQAALVLDYARGTGAYEIDQLLQPDQQMWIDVGQLIRNQVPDKKGTVLPASLTMGSYEIRELTQTGPSLFEGKVVYDKKYGSVTYGCGSCCGYKGAEFDYNPLGIPLDGEEDQGVEGLDTCTGTWNDLTSAFYNTWSTQDSSIATVNADGVHTGVAIGSTLSQAHAEETLWEKVNDCPLGELYPEGGDNVQPQVSVNCTPQNLALGPTAPSSTTTGLCTATVSPSGGKYSWTVNTGTVTLVNPTSASPSFTAANASSSEGDTTISLTYTVNEQQATAQSSAITVHEPTSLQLDSDTTNPTGTTCSVTCLNGQPGCSYQSYLKTRIYDVLDQFGLTFASVGISTINGQESFSGFTSSCGASSPTPTTAGTSHFQDNFNFCAPDCQQGGPGCTASATQTITVNGLTVRTPSVNWSCTNCTVVP